MCGVFGIFRHPEASRLTVYGLYGLQHRGQESAGIVTGDGESLHAHIGMGLVSKVFGNIDFKDLPGDSAIGHVRYSTSGSSNIRNAQPILVSTQHGEVGLSHNGNLVNGSEMRETLEQDGAIFSSTTDSEVILHGLARAKQPTLLDALVDSLQKIRGAFSLVVLTRDALIGVRDPSGFRPLILGELEGADILTSESTALDLLQARYVREIKPGEVFVATAGGHRSIFPFNPLPVTPCIFEYVYFARPDTLLYDKIVHSVRFTSGKILAQEQPVEADAVVPVPDSGVGAAMGYAEESGIPLFWGLIRNHYVGRTFIAPQQSLRDFSTRLKLNPVPEILRGKRVVLVDDSLVRGTTCRKIVRLVRDAGADEVHLRLSSPPVVNPCVYGIDTPHRSKLLAANLSIPEIRDFVGADSVGYLSVEGLHQSLRSEKGTMCYACFGGPYPVEWDEVKITQSPLFSKERQ